MRTINILDDNKKEKQTTVEEWIASNHDIYHDKQMGNIDYPVETYYLDLQTAYLRYIRWHWHEEMEILICNTGTAEILTDNGNFTIKPGQAIILNQNVMHSIRAKSDEHCTFYTIIFHPDFLFYDEKNGLHNQFLMPMQNANAFKTYILDESNPQHEPIFETINNIIAVNVAKPFAFQVNTRGSLYVFWFHLLNLLPKEDYSKVQPFSLDDQRVKGAILYIKRHMANAITLEDIAGSVHISKSECCRCFSRTLHMTPFEYLMRYRIFEATRKMTEATEQNLPISEIAMAVGFNNTSYFNKLFKKYIGCTPTYYRKHQSVDNKQVDRDLLGIPLF